MTALYKVVGADGHVVTQIVEAELVVSSECYISLISLAALLRVWLVLVYTVDGQAMELVEGAHPLGVALCQIVVHRNHVHTSVCQCVKENRKRCHKCFSFAGCHFGNLAFMQSHTSNELHVVVNHIPGYRRAAGSPCIKPYSLVAANLDAVANGGNVAVHLRGRNLNLFALFEAAGRVFDYCEGARQQLVEHIGNLDVDSLFNFVNLIV